jgi:hypothetical protein
VNGYEVLAYPTVYNPNRIASIPQAADAVRSNEVSLRGWNFPHTDRENAGPFAKGFQSTTMLGASVEGYRLYLSGLFMWRRPYWEDVDGHKSEKGRPVLSFIAAIYSFTEFFLFLSRLYERIAPDATIHVVTTMSGCNGRELATFDARVHLLPSFVAQDDVIRQKRDVQVAELRGSHLAIAAGMVKHALHVFGWMDATDAMIATWQQRLLKREF